MPAPLTPIADARQVFDSLVGNIPRLRTHSRRIQLGRSLIAFAQLLTLSLTSWPNLTADVLTRTPGLYCSGARAISLFCLGSSTPNEIGKWIGIAITVVVIAGVLPRYTSILHAWLSLSIAISLSLPDGGEAVAVFSTFLIIFIAMPDERVIAWTTRYRQPTSIRLAAIAYAGSIVLCLQLAGIYLESGLSKIAVGDWANGTAMFYVTRDPMFGAAGPLGAAAQWFTSAPLGTALLTWGTIALECCIAVFFLLPARYKIYGLAGATVLHLGIAILMGLWSFGLIMIGTAAAAAYQLRQAPTGEQRPTDGEGIIEVPAAKSGRGE